MRHHGISPIRVLGYVGWIAVALTGLDLGLRLAADAAGVWGVLAASVLAPATIAAAPLMALAWGQWMPALVVYGGGFTAAMLMARTNPERGSVHPPTF